jgi:hypothetical protein
MVLHRSVETARVFGKFAGETQLDRRQRTLANYC